MMDEGQIIFDISGEEKSKLTVKDLLDMFEKKVKNFVASDKELLTK